MAADAARARLRRLRRELLRSWGASLDQHPPRNQQLPPRALSEPPGLRDDASPAAPSSHDALAPRCGAADGGLHLVRLGYGLELELGSGVVRVLVRVPLAGHLVVSLLDLGLGRILVHPQDRVVIFVTRRER